MSFFLVIAILVKICKFKVNCYHCCSQNSLQTLSWHWIFVEMKIVLTASFYDTTTKKGKLQQNRWQCMPLPHMKKWAWYLIFIQHDKGNAILCTQNGITLVMLNKYKIPRPFLIVSQSDNLNPNCNNENNNNNNNVFYFQRVTYLATIQANLPWGFLLFTLYTTTWKENA